MIGVHLRQPLMTSRSGTLITATTTVALTVVIADARRGGPATSEMVAAVAQVHPAVLPTTSHDWDRAGGPHSGPPSP